MNLDLSYLSFYDVKSFSVLTENGEHHLIYPLFMNLVCRVYKELVEWFVVRLVELP